MEDPGHIGSVGRSSGVGRSIEEGGPPLSIAAVGEARDVGEEGEERRALGQGEETQPG